MQSLQQSQRLRQRLCTLITTTALFMRSASMMLFPVCACCVLTLSRMSVLAPCVRRYRTISIFPFSAAMCKGVSPFFVCTFTSALESHNNSAVSFNPNKAAQ